MSTKITVNVTGNQLVQRNKEEQLANRNSQLEKEIDAKFAEDIKAIETEAIKQAPALGAVPEYRVIEETSAHRKGGGYGNGWLLKTFESNYLHGYADKEKMRIAVSSGNGESSAFFDLELPMPALDGFTLTRAGYKKWGKVYFDTMTFPLIEGNLNPICPDLASFSVDRSNFFIESYNVIDRFFVDIMPISKDAAIVFGSAYLASYIQRSYDQNPATDYILPAGYEISTSFVIGELAVILSSQPNPNSPCFWLGTYDPQGDSVSFVNYPYGPSGRLRYAWILRYGIGDFPVDGSDRTVGEPKFIPLNAYTYSTQIVRKNFAFYVDHKKCREIDVPTELAQKLEAIAPTPNFNAGGVVDAWPSVLPIGLGFGFNSDDSSWGEIRFGTPSIYDIIDNDFDYELFFREEPVKSKYNKRPPLIYPDFASGEYKEGDFIGSAFNFNQQLQPNSYVVAADPALSSSVYLNTYFATYADTFFYLPSDLLIGNRQAHPRAESFYYTYSQLKSILDQAPEDPVYFLTQKQPTLPPEVPGITFNPELNPQVPTWLPATENPRKVVEFSLSPNRVLPEALFNPDDTDHPLIEPQPVIDRHINIAIGTPTALADFSKLPYAYTPYSFITLLWSDWDRPWRSNLFKLGFKASGLR